MAAGVAARECVGRARAAVVAPARSVGYLWVDPLNRLHEAIENLGMPHEAPELPWRRQGLERFH